MKKFLCGFLTCFILGVAITAILADDDDYAIETLQPDGALNCIRRKRDNAGIPKDPANTDYQAFVIWNNARTVPLVVPDHRAPVDPIPNALRNAINTQKAVVAANTWTAVEIRQFNQAQAIINKFLLKNAMAGDW